MKMSVENVATVCLKNGCGKTATIRGYCNTHYYWAWRNKRLPPRPTAADRLWARVIKGESCWEWKGSLDTNGYGQIHVNGRFVMVHTLSYNLLVGKIPEGLELDHLCRNPVCVNPAHLEPVSHKENVLRGVSPAAQLAKLEYCKRGHPLSGDNLYPTSHYRRCKLCCREKEAEYRKKRRQRTTNSVAPVGNKS